jgi:N-acetylmuramoyl-L-alanine amidase
MKLSVKDFTLPAKTHRPLSMRRSAAMVMLFAILTMAGSICLPASYCLAATIVLDPGHGGIDTGAGKGSEYTEKQFTLALAQKIAGLLSVKYRVELTRTADIELTPEDRAGVANHRRADLMVSLHAAVAPYCSDRSAGIYYYSDARLSIPSRTTIQGKLADSDDNQQPWAMLQDRHKHQSQELALSMKKSFVKSGTFDHVTVNGAPLAALMGADMPAVLVEVGCMHTGLSPSPSDIEEQLNQYAHAIASAIEAALPALAP